MSIPPTAKPYRFETPSSTTLSHPWAYGLVSRLYLWGAVATPFPFLDHPGPLAFAHRGGGGEAPENSWAAFEHAISLGYRYLETDVRTTADGVALALHDPTLDRVTARPGALSKMTWDQVRQTRLPDGRDIPLLEELLSAWPEARWNIDVKAPEAVTPVVEVIKRTASLDRVLLTAFTSRRTAKARSALGPTLAIGAGPGTVAALIAAKVGVRARVRSHAVAAQVPLQRRGVHIVDAAFLRVCHQSGLAVHVWTINDPVVMEGLLDLGVDGIMTDLPSTLKQVLERRGQWA
jgi:glycerophosphoryl diester phosphodiesterase